MCLASFSFLLPLFSLLTWFLHLLGFVVVTFYEYLKVLQVLFWTVVDKNKEINKNHIVGIAHCKGLADRCQEKNKVHYKCEPSSLAFQGFFARQTFFKI
jgi:hypothetical protein